MYGEEVYGKHTIPGKSPADHGTQPTHHTEGN